MSRIAPSALVIVGLLVAFAGAGYAQPAPAASGNWAKSHPRRAEVNARLANQNRRIHHEVAEGSMSPAQAAQLHREDHRIRQEERAMASQTGGHITKAGQRVLNAQENQVSRQIGK
ncbi:MAG: hypothetical protein KGN16_24360 [Burkholderiales bacterium]|nr:hypothetical protein [Burkholderiales bacterium]